MRVLVPLDGSPRSLDAMVRGLAMLPPGTEATLLCVQSSGFKHASDDRLKEFEEDEGDEIFPTRDSCERMLQTAMKKVPKGIKGTSQIASGKVTSAILDAAKGYDLMIMHRLGASGLKEKLRMSATERLARQAACSVLLVDD